MKKYLMVILTTLFIMLNIHGLYGAEPTEDTVVKKNSSAFNLKTSTVSITGNLPYVNGDAYEINRHIKSLIENQAGQAQKSGYKTLDITFNTTIQEEVYSLIIYYRYGNAVLKADTVVFNNAASPKTLLRLSDQLILGKNGLKLSNKLVNSVIAQNPSRYNSDFAGIKDTSDFYLENDIIYFIFDKYEIGPGAAGIQEIPLDRSKIKSLEIKNSDYHFGGNYNVRMVPLRSICEGFGYSVSWTPKNASLEPPEIELARGDTLYHLFPGINKYALNNYLFVTLESPPEIFDDMAYVPISYMEEVLGLAIYASPAGNITFSEYLL